MAIALCRRCRSVVPGPGQCPYCGDEAAAPDNLPLGPDGLAATAEISARKLACPDIAGRGKAKRLTSSVYSPLTGDQVLAYEIELRTPAGEVVLRWSDLAPFEVQGDSYELLRVSGLHVAGVAPTERVKGLPGALDGIVDAMGGPERLGPVEAFQEAIEPGDSVVVRAFDVSHGGAGLGYREAALVRHVRGEPGAPMALVRLPPA